ncbi:MAG: tetratricopeptide repeat protein [Cytophagales bacterium]|nr:tetratricopeptide repeat protein [Cytophagales bacterium]MDW8383586.1 tetratricopeptide repeat protein [Flammeovirgaceae bacterium]
MNLHILSLSVFITLNAWVYAQKGANLPKEVPQEYLEALFIEAIKYKITDNFSQALNKFLEIDSYRANATVKYEIARCYYQMNQIEKAIEFAEKALALDNSKALWWSWLSSLYNRQRNLKKSELCLKQAIKINPTKDYFVGLIDLYESFKKLEDIIKVCEKYESLFGFDEKIALRKQRTYLQLKNLEAANKEMERILLLGREVESSVVNYIKLLIRSDIKEEAAVLLSKYIQKFPDNPELRSLELSIKGYSSYSDVEYSDLEFLLKNSELEIEKKIEIMVNILKYKSTDKDRLQGLALAKALANAYPENSQVHIVLGDFFSANNNILEALAAYQKALHIDGNNHRLWLQLLGIEYLLSNYDSLILHSEEAISYFPNEPLFYLYNGIGYVAKKKYHEALESLKAGLMISDNQEIVQLQFYAQLGDVYHNLKNYEKCDESYRIVMNHDKNNLYVLNNWSYYLALRRENLEFAASMASQLVALAPENPTYLDTYGWVLYALGNYEEAEKYISRALSLSSSPSATIIEHYGDVLFKLNRKEEAVSHWKKALEQGSEDSFILKQKIVEQRLIETK